MPYCARIGSFGQGVPCGWRRWLVMIVVLLAGAAYGGDAQGTIIGTVVEEGTGEPLGHALSAHVLHADDHLSLEEDGDFIESRYGNSYGWLRLRSALGSRVSAETVASVGIVSRERLGEDKSDVWDTWGQRIIGHRVSFSLDEDRRFSVLGLKQDWNWEISERGLLTGGIDLKHLDSRYDYFNQEFVFEGEETGPVEGRYDTMLVAERPEGFQLGAYAGGRYRPVPYLIAEVGVRYDRMASGHATACDCRRTTAWICG